MADQFPLKICFVSPGMYPLFNPLVKAPFGGGESQLYELAAFFGRDPQVEVSVVTGDFGQDEIEYYSGVMVYRINNPKSIPFWKRWHKKPEPLTDTLKKTGARIFIMAGASPLCHDVYTFCRRYKRAFVFRVAHQRDCDRTYINASGEEGSRFRMALQNTAAIVTQTGEQSLLLRRMENMNSTMIPNLVQIPPPPDYAKKKDVLWIGNALTYKQPELYMRIARTLPAFSFTMMMFPGEAGYFEKLIAATRDVANIGVHNSVPYHELSSFLQRTKLIVNTSRFEGVPMAFTHALAHGIPIASLNVDPDGMLEQHQCGLSARGSEMELVQIINDLLSYDRQWIKRAENAYEYACDYLDIHHTIHEYKKLFLQLSTPKR